MTSNKNEVDEKMLDSLELTDKYDDALSIYNAISLKDYALLYIIFIVLSVFVIWANVATVDELTRGDGKVIPSSDIQIIQNLEGGIIDAIHVKEGDIVNLGQKLMNMSNVQSGADYQANLQKSFVLRASITRLKAEISEKDPVFSKSLLKDAKDIIDLEKNNYKANILQRNDELKILEQQLDQKTQEVLETKERLNGAKKILDLSMKEHSMIKPLAERGTVSKVELLQLDSKIAGEEAKYKNLLAVLKRAKASMKEAEETLKSHKTTTNAKIQKEVSEKTAELNALNEVLSAYLDRSNRTEIKSPVYGTVKDIKINTIGGVIQPGEDIIEIVPLNDQLIIEANISPSDIAFLHPEQRAKIKITAYDYEIYGDIDATVKDISADTLKNENGESFYRVKLQSDEFSLRHEDKDLPIIPGMVASVDIVTGEKTIMSYLLNPFRRTVKNAMHER